MDRPRLFKSYGPFQAADIPGLSIWQAARATSAAPTFFKRIRIGSKNMEEDFIDGGMGSNNPTQVLLREATHVFDATAPVACILSIGTGEASIIEVKEPTFFQKIVPIELINAMKEMITDCRNTADAVQYRFQKSPGLYFRLNVDQGLQGVGLEEWREMGAIKAKTLLYLDRVRDVIDNVALSLTSDTVAAPCLVRDLGM